MTNSDTQIALITGGASGLGLGCAQSLIKSGVGVVLASRNESKLKETVSSLKSWSEKSVPINYVVCDVTKEEEVENACRYTSTAGVFNKVVLSSGIGAAGPIHLTSLDSWKLTMATNLTGAFLTIKHSVPYLVTNGGGSIVAVSSISGHVTHRFMTPYNVSKAGLEMLIRQTADELGPVGIRANAVRPGVVPTDMTNNMLNVEVIRDDFLNQIPLNRIGTPNDVGSVVNFLLSDDSSWITGACINVDGGIHLRRGPNIEPIMELLFGPNRYPGSGNLSE